MNPETLAYVVKALLGFIAILWAAWVIYGHYTGWVKQSAIDEKDALSGVLRALVVNVVVIFLLAQ